MLLKSTGRTVYIVTVERVGSKELCVVESHEALRFCLVDTALELLDGCKPVNFEDMDNEELVDYINNIVRSHSLVEYDICDIMELEK